VFLDGLILVSTFVGEKNLDVIKIHGTTIKKLFVFICCDGIMYTGTKLITLLTWRFNVMKKGVRLPTAEL